MRTTLAIDDRILQRVRALAARQGRLLQDCVNELLELGLASQGRGREVAESLPTYHFGKPSVDVADRDALYDALDGDEP